MRYNRAKHAQRKKRVYAQNSLNIYHILYVETSETFEKYAGKELRPVGKVRTKTYFISKLRKHFMHMLRVQQ